MRCTCAAVLQYTVYYTSYQYGNHVNLIWIVFQHIRFETSLGRCADGIGIVETGDGDELHALLIDIANRTTKELVTF